MRISEHCELAFLATMTVLKFGLVEGAEEGAPVLQRLRPLQLAFQDAARDFRNHMRQHTALFPETAKNRNVFAALVNRDLAEWSESLAAWAFRFDDYPSPPSSFANFPPPLCRGLRE